MTTVARDRKRLIRLLGPQKLIEALFGGSTLFFSIVVLAILGGILLSLLAGSALTFKTFGLGFVWHDAWSPVKGDFGALVPMYGTIATSIIAMIISIPLSFGVAVFITELCPAWLKRPLSVSIELLAGIPSIIYGIWGLFILAPFLQSTVEPALIGIFGHVPVLSALFSGPPLGVGVLTAGLILAIMILPYISSIMRDVFETVPPMLKEAAYGIGCTTWEVVWRIVLPYTKVGVVGGIMLGLGRAMGETMAVTFVIGNSHRISGSLLAPGQTISSALANEFTEAVDDQYQSALIALGLVLFVITCIVLAAAKVMLLRMQRRAGS